MSFFFKSTLLLFSVAIFGCTTNDDQNMNSPSDISLQYYQLGDCPIDNSIFAKGKNWRYDFGGMNQQEVTRLLRLRMVEFEDESLLRLGKYIFQLTPTELVYTDTNVWLHLQAKFNGYDLFLSCRECPLDIKDCFSSNKFACEFVACFSELRTTLPGNAGAFTNDCLRLEDWAYDEVDVPTEWNDAVSFYHAVNGDCLFVRDDGRVAWDVMGEGIISKFEGSLSDVINVFVSCQESMGNFDFHKFEEIISRQQGIAAHKQKQGKQPGQ